MCVLVCHDTLCGGKRMACEVSSLLSCGFWRLNSVVRPLPVESSHWPF